MSAEVIILADRRRARTERDLASRQADLLLAPYRFGLTVTLSVVLAALAPFIGRCR